VDELGAYFVVLEKSEDKPDDENSILVWMKETFMIIPSKEKSVIYHFSEFDYGGKIPNLVKQ